MPDTIPQKINCKCCGNSFFPDDKDDIYCSEECLNIDNGQYDDEEGDV